MALRPGRTIKQPKRPWSRVSRRKPKKGYVVGEPHPRIHVFNMGNKSKEFETEIYLVAKEPANIRDNALESARQVTQKHLEKKLGVENYFFKILIYPHNVLREKSIATGAGADRFSQGMRKAFGRPSGKAAIVKKDQKLFVVNTSKKNLKAVKEAFKRADSKIRCRTRVVVEE